MIDDGPTCLATLTACIGFGKPIWSPCNGVSKKQSIIFEVVCDHNLYVWHTFFGLHSGNNDINVLDRSPLVRDMLNGDISGVGY